MRPVIIYGPQGSGKRHAEAAFAARGIEVVREWSPDRPLMAGSVVSTNVAPPYKGVDAVVLKVAGDA